MCIHFMIIYVYIQIYKWDFGTLVPALLLMPLSIGPSGRRSGPPVGGLGGPGGSS